MKLFHGVVFTLVVAVVGCQSAHYTSFAPLNARLEPIPHGGARHLVIVNTSGRKLHNCKFSADMWNDKNPRMQRNHTRRFYGSGAELAPGQSVRFHELARTIETPITERISCVEIVGHCDEGYFRQAWLYSDADQLQPMVGSSQQNH